MKQIKEDSALKVHPAADVFPMMSEDELAELAADIKENGLIYPIMKDREGQVIDGRNRLAACKLAGVDPTFQTLDGQNPLAYIVSANLERRNLTKGQQAMVLAMIYPEPGKGGRGKKNPSIIEGIHGGRLSVARSVFKYSEELAQAVLKGTIPLEEAMRTVQQEKQKATGIEAQIARIRKAAPDLADQVADQTLTLGEALAAWNEREAAKQRVRDSGKAGLIALKEFPGWIASIASAMELGEKGLLDSELMGTISKSIRQLEKLWQNEKEQK